VAAVLREFTTGAVDDIFEQPAENTTLDASSASRFRFEPVSRAELLPIMGVPSER
jgi:hypothetical protein